MRRAPGRGHAELAPRAGKSRGRRYGDLWGCVLHRRIKYRAVFKNTLITEDREDLTEALFELDRCRRASRIASFRSALDHGMSINELARIWGILPTNGIPIRQRGPWGGLGGQSGLHAILVDTMVGLSASRRVC